MSRCPEPGEPGYNPSVFFAFGINIGLRLAREVGTGLPLVNALRDRFPDVELSILGDIASTVGQGIKAGTSFAAGPPDAVPMLNAMPVVPPTLIPGGEAERVVVMADMDFSIEQAGNAEEWRVLAGIPEDLTLQEVIDLLTARFIAMYGEDYPDEAEELAVQHATIFFLGRRY